MAAQGHSKDPSEYRGSRVSLLLLWSGQLFSALGDRLHELALIWISVQAIGAEAGLVAAAGTASRLVFGLPGGVWADRWNRRRVMIGADVIRAAAVATLALAGYYDGITLTHLAVVAAVIAALDALFAPALQASLPLLARDAATLQRANAALDVNRRLALILGPGLSGVLLSAMPLERFFAIDAATYVVSAAAILAIGRRLSQRVAEVEHTAPFARELREAMQLVWHNRRLRWALGMMLVANLAYAVAWIVGLPLLARDVFGGGAESYGALLAAYGVGNVASNLVIAFRGGSDTTRLLFAGGIVYGSGLALLAFTPTFEAALVVCALTAVGGPMTDLMLLLIVQTEFPPSKIGKVFAFRSTLSQVSMGIGLLLAGPLYHTVPLRGGIAIAGVSVAVVATLALLRFVRPAAHERGDHPDGTGAGVHLGSPDGSMEGTDGHRHRRVERDRD